MAGTAEAIGENILEQAADWRRSGRGVAVATVVATWGSSPRPVGSQLAVDADGQMIGSVSGGCIEGAVVREAQEVIAGGPPERKIIPIPKSIRTGKRNVQNIAPRSRA